MKMYSDILSILLQFSALFKIFNVKNLRSLDNLEWFDCEHNDKGFNGSSLPRSDFFLGSRNPRDENGFV